MKDQGPRKSIVGRGAAGNPNNRFERIEVEPDEIEGDEPRPETVYLRDHSRSIIARNYSPDIGFDASINPYRGCSHGCIYCFARPTHEYLGLSAGLDFESRILVKQDAPELLRKELSSPRWNPQVLSMSGVTDPYQPVERRLRITRRCLEVLAEFRNPVVIVTKNYLVTRDMDLLSELASHDAAAVAFSLTTLDDDLRRIMEPRTSRPTRRLAAIEKLAAGGIPVGVMTAPVIPGLNDHELPNLLSAAAEAGATFAAYVPVRLPYAVAPLFEDWLAHHFPERKDKVLNRIRSMRGGELNDANFGSRMRGEGLFAQHIAQLFSISCRRAGMGEGGFPKLSTAAFRGGGGVQPDLFG
ncbi:MAG TPA: PA0069 family radical SAM protein [Rubrobacteraceae bacterium]|nr:PA0069 family radical SAM protein [Rubrobacteraceae bacterium]